MNETKKIVSEIKDMIVTADLSKEDIEILRQTLAMLKVKIEKSLAEDLVGDKEEVSRVLGTKAEELLSILRSEKDNLSLTSDMTVEKKAEIDSLQDALVKTIEMRDSMKEGDLVRAIDSLLTERKDEIESLIEPCVGILVAGSGINFETFFNRDLGEHVKNSDTYNVTALLDVFPSIAASVFTDKKIRQQVKRCYEKKKETDEIDNKFQEFCKARLTLLVDELYGSYKIDGDSLTESGEKSLRENIRKLNKYYIKLTTDFNKEEKHNRYAGLEKERQKKLEEIRNLSNIQQSLENKLKEITKARERIKSAMPLIPEDKAIQEYTKLTRLSYAERQDLLKKYSDEVITLEEYNSAHKDYERELYRLPSNVREVIVNYKSTSYWSKQFGFDPYKLLLTQDSEIISAILIEPIIKRSYEAKKRKRIMRGQSIDSNPIIDFYDIQDKYNEVKARHEAKKQAQQQNINNQNIQSMQEGIQMGSLQNNIDYIGEFIEEESQGMKM